MVTKVNGNPERGFWFSKDVRTVTIAATAGGDFVDDADGTNGPDSALEQVIEVVQARATVIALSISAVGTVSFIVDYANAFTAGNVETDTGTVEEEVAAAIDGVIGSLATVAVSTFDGFLGATSL